MIVREIKADPEIIDRFDWFNDYNDTRLWALRNAPELVARLDEGHAKWLQSIHSAR